ncbi:MAG TPA: sulfite exporter TauE/SafE family protein [Sedimentisphaerales bacterium]|nr:sulfite exporter TauE/SafE family protein [Sedimentisphaerales bacterium]
MIALLPGHWWAFIVLGVGAGIISGALGLGSGAVVVPVLVLFCGFEQKSAQGTALAVMVPMTLLGAWRYWKNPEIEMSLVIVLLIALGALAGVLAGTEIAGRLPNQTLRKVFAVFLAIVAIKMFTASPKPAKSGTGEDLISRSRMSLMDPGDTKNDAKQ